MPTPGTEEGYAESIWSRLEVVARERPDAVAVVSDEGEVTFRALQGMAEAVSCHVLALDACSSLGHPVVALLMPRSASLLACMLGCARAGIPFAAFDLSQPKERIKGLLSQLEVLAVIGEEEWHVGPLIVPPKVTSPSPCEPSLFQAQFSEDLYICFTSGSSGVPKAVRGSQTATLNRLRWMWKRLPFGTSELVLQKTSVAFVDSICEYFGGILQGVPLNIIEDDIAKDSHRLLEAILKTKPTRLTVVPSLIEHYLSVVKETVLRRALASVRVLVCSGEALRWATAGKLQQYAPSCKILNLYGSTEVTGDVSYHLFSMDSFSNNKYCIPGQEASLVSQFVPIGVPIDGCELHVIAADGKPALACNVGELYVTGVGLSLGYLSSLEEGFADLVIAEKAVRAYNTGDLAFQGADGLFHYVGRVDDQLKINGHRISLLEVQLAVQGISAVAEAAVVSVPVSGDDLKHLLCAFYTTTSGEPVGDGALRSALSFQLPGYMIPSVFSHALYLPSTPSGKVDKRALTSQFEAAQGRPRTAVEPSSALEQRLHSCVKQFFGVPAVGLDITFFALGADSLRLAELAHALHQIGVPAQLNQLITHPTISSLATALRDAPGHPRALRPGPPHEDRLPLTRAQAGLLFLEELHRGQGSAYAVDAAYWLKGTPMTEKLMVSLRLLCLRHPVLRYRVDSSQAEPVAALLPDGEGLVRFIDLRTMCAQLQGPALKEFVRQELQAQICWRPFDLGERVAELVVVQATDDEACLLVHAHHLAVDGWSLRLIVQDIAALFSGAPELPLLPLQLSDFADWETRILGSETEREPLRRYWSEQLELAEDACVSLRPHGIDSGGVGSAVATCTRTLPSLHQDMSSALQQYGVSSFALIATSLTVLLHRYSQQDGVILGVPCALRDSVDMQHVVGMLVNMLPLHVRLSSSDTRFSAVKIVADALGSGIAHSSYPFEEIVRDNCPQRQADRNPIFQMILVQEELDNSELLAEAGVASSVELFKISNAGAKCDIVFIVRTDPHSGATQLALEYATGLFTEAAIATLLQQWVVILDGFIHESSDTLVCEVPLQSDEALHSILHERNDVAVLFPADHHLMELFDEIVARSPDRVGMVHGDTSLSFQDIQDMSGHIAALVEPHGQSRLVGICLPRGVEAIASIFGILRANCGYVPLDPELPPARLQHMVTTAEIGVVIVCDSTIPVVEALGGDVVSISVETLPTGSCPVKSSRRDDFEASKCVAAVLFTSGSTGKPKGIKLTHRGIASRCRSNKFISVDESDCIGQVNTLNFDLSIFEVFFSLLNGVQLAIVDKCVLLHPQYFAEELRRCEVTTLLLPTSVFHSHARTRPSTFSGLRTLMFGGEKPNSSLVASVMNAVPDIDIVNLSGPTEITFASHFYHVAEIPAPEDVLPLGKAMTNTSTYVVDDRMQPVPEGVPGELLIGGPGVSLGYIQAEELTKEKFVCNPFPAPEGHDVLVRTGDMAKWLPDGNLEFVGRRDFQVKIRGHRVEPEDVQRVLEAIPLVDEAIVVFDRLHGLCGYVVARSDAKETIDSFVTSQLPDYMRPAALVCMASLPKTHRGKVDRAALPAPVIQQVGTCNSLSPAEQLICDLYEELTEVRPLSPETTFFDVGGHSLLLVRLIALLCERFLVDVTVRQLFTDSSVRSLATLVSTCEQLDRPAKPSWQLISQSIVPGTPYPLSIGQRQLWTAQMLQPLLPHYNVPVALEITGDLGVCRLQQALVTLQQRHAILRARILLMPDGTPMQMFEDTTSVLEFDTSESARLPALLDEVHMEPFILEQGCLFRATLVSILDRLDTYVLALTLHHIVCDGISIELLVKELRALYLGEVVSPPTCNFTDFVTVELQRESVFSFVSSASAYWSSHLEGYMPLQLSSGTESSAVRDPLQAGTIVVHLTAAEVICLENAARTTSSTIFTLLLTTFMASLAQLADSSDVLVNVIEAFRPSSRLADCVGYFVRSLPLRLLVDLGLTGEGFAPAVTEGLLAARDHGVPDVTTLSKLQPTHEHALRDALGQIAFVFQSQSTSSTSSWGSLAVDRILYDLPVNKFEVAMEWAKHGSGGLQGTLSYNTELITRHRAATLIHLHLTALRQLPSRLQHPLGELLRDDRHPILQQDHSETMCSSIVDSLWKQELQLNDTALVEQHMQLSYRELQGEVWRLAASLDKLLDGKANRFCGVMLPRGKDSVVTMLALWQCGAVYVPLDSQAPPGRLARILSETSASVVLVDDSTSHRLEAVRERASLEATVITLACLPTAGELKQDHVCSGADIAYILYTSGTTGQPKGVAVSHKACLSHVAVGPVLQTDVVLHSNSLGFDPSIWEVLSCLFAGATLVIATRETLLDISSFKDYLQAFKVTFALLPTVFFHSIVAKAPATFSSLRYLAVGGESVSPASLQSLFFTGQAPREVWNWYGPTEAAVVASYFQVLPQMVARERQLRKSIPIGKAFPNTSLFAVIDDRLATPGETGELFVGGPCLARGYLNLPEATERVFVRDRWTAAVSSKVYRTGDLVRCLPDGNFVFLGRIDRQVKVQGYRVEIMEVQRTIASHELVQEVAVLATDAPQGGTALAVFFVASTAISEDQLRSWTGEKLPSYMVAQFYTRLPRLPRVATDSKVDYAALKELLRDRAQQQSSSSIAMHAPHAPRDSATHVPIAGERQEVTDALKALWAERLGGADVGLDSKFFEVGGTSIGLILLHRSLQEKFQMKISVSALLEHTTVRSQADFILAMEHPEPLHVAIPDESLLESHRGGDTIAVVGMACRAPMAGDVYQFWAHLEEGADCITRKDGMQENLRASLAHDVAALGVLEDVDDFDMSCFNMTPMLSSITDPQHRVLLELCHTALESAAIDPANLQAGKSGEQGDKGIGVFAGLASNTYASEAGLSDRQQDPSLAFEVERANIADSAPALVAFKLGLQGPAVAVQTACSSSAVSIHMACTSLRNGECLAALAGGVGISFPQEETYKYQPGMIMSSDGVCRPFDAGANGSVSGNGGGMLLLMRVSDATALNVPVLALVKGSAVNNDGSEKASYSSSSAPSQAAVMRQALHRSGVMPEDVTFLESHGTGTPVGDLIEATAIAEVYAPSRRGTDIPELVVGSVKSNIGHLGPAAAVLSTIKAVLALQHRTIPPTAHFTELHPFITALSPQFRVNQTTEAWPEGRPLVAAVNSFGQGGTNVHLLLSSPGDSTTVEKATLENSWQILPFSAASSWSLRSNMTAVASAIGDSWPVESLQPLAVTLQEGRQQYQLRQAVVCSDLETAKEALEKGGCETTSAHTEVAFVFPGQGSQYVGMGQELYTLFPQYRMAFDECQRILAEDHDIDLSSVLLPEEQAFLAKEEPEGKLKETLYSQLSVFVTSYACFRLLESFSVAPDYLIGHSLGEFTAATIAGVISLRAALALVKQRGELMQSMPRGSMVALRTDWETASQLAKVHGLDLAAHNSATQVVLSGPLDSCKCLLDELEGNENVTATLLKTSHAYHSTMMAPAAAQFRKAVKSVSLRSPSRVIISSVTGKQLTVEEATTHEYWVSQMLQPVLFYSASQTLAGILQQTGSNIAIVQVGPGKWQSSMQRRLLPSAASLFLLEKGASPSFRCATTVARLWELGVNVQWSALHDASRPVRRLRIPTYRYDKVPCQPVGLRFSFPTFEERFFEGGDSCEVEADVTTPPSSDGDFVTRSEFSSVCEELSEMKRMMEAITTHLGVGPVVSLRECADYPSVCAPLLELLQHPELELSVTRTNGRDCTTTALSGEGDDTVPRSIGCLSSLFTLMILDHCERQGFVSHDTLVSSLLPVSQKKVTLGHLAAHTSGLPCLPTGIDFSMDPTGVTAATASVKQLLDAYERAVLVHGPGDRCTYSVFGSALLGHALAAASLLVAGREVDLGVTHEVYQALLTEVVLEPLQLRETGLASVRGSRWCAGSSTSSAFLQSGAQCPPWVCGPAFATADGTYSSARDLGVVLGSLLDKNKWATVRRHMLRAPGGRLWFSGLCPGSAAWMALSPSQDTGVVLLSNTGIDVSAELTSCGGRCLCLAEGVAPDHIQLLTPTLLEFWSEKSVATDYLDSKVIPARAVASAGKAPHGNGNIEGEIMRIASKLLGKNVCQGQDDATFHELGFDSLLSISFVAQLQQAFRTRLPVLPVAAVFQYPTAVALADFIREQLGSPAVAARAAAPVATSRTDAPRRGCEAPRRNYGIPMGACLRGTTRDSVAGQLLRSSLPYVVTTPPGEDVLAIVASDGAEAAELLSSMPALAPELHRLLQERGGIFFSGFSFSGSEQLAALVQEFTGADSFLDYKDGISPRTAVMANKVFTSTEYPPQYDMGLHNEMR